MKTKYGATFTDGTFLTWKELRLADNGKKYGYKDSAITDTSIDVWAFLNCPNLISISIPNSVTRIGPSAFALCSNLASVEIPDSATSIGAYAFYSCTSLTSMDIPDSIASIGERAFLNCKNLNSVSIPPKTIIGEFAFLGCPVVPPPHPWNPICYNQAET